MSSRVHCTSSRLGFDVALRDSSRSRALRLQGLIILEEGEESAPKAYWIHGWIRKEPR